MEDFNIGAMKVRNIMTQFGVADQESEEIAKARQVGDVHPNGKWVWTEYKPGHFDWRPLKGGGSPKKDDEGGSKKTNASSKTSGADVSKFMDALKIFKKRITDESKITVSKTPRGNWNVSYDGYHLGIVNRNMLSDKAAEEKGWIEGSQKKALTLDDHAKKTPTKTLENAAKKEGVPGSIRGAAEAELKTRRDAEITKKLNLRSKGELANNLVKIASEWSSYSDSDKQIIKQSISQAREQIIEEIDGGNFSTESMNYLADLQSVEKYIKGVESGPKPVGEIIDKLLFELKNKDYIKEQKEDSLESTSKEDIDIKEGTSKKKIIEFDNPESVDSLKKNLVGKTVVFGREPHEEWHDIDRVFWNRNYNCVMIETDKGEIFKLSQLNGKYKIVD